MTKQARRVREVVEVPGAESMSNETLFKHINARHLVDIGLRETMHYSDALSEGLIDTHRAFHRRCHLMATPGQYDHEHDGEN